MAAGFVGYKVGKIMNKKHILLATDSPDFNNHFCNFFDQFGAGHEEPRLNLFNC